MTTPRNLSSSKNYASRRGAIKLLYEKQSGTLTYLQHDGHQSAVDRNGLSLDTYIHAIYGLLLQTDAKKILMIGCGGGVLGRMLHDAGRKVTIIDIDPMSFKLAKRYFGLARDVPCHAGDGLAFLQKTRRRFDALVIDAFIGEQIPEQMTGEPFWRAVRKVLGPDGSFFMNVCLSDKSDFTADMLCRRAKKTGWTARLLDQRGHARNAIVMGGKVKGLRPPALLRAPQSDRPRVKRELKGMHFRRVRSSKRKLIKGILVTKAAPRLNAAQNKT